MPFSISSLCHLVGHLLAVQIGVRPGVRAHGVAGGINLTQDFRMTGRVLADRKNNPWCIRRRALSAPPACCPAMDRRRRSARLPSAARKSNCLKFSKPKPGPPVVSISTTRETPSASGLAAGRLLRRDRCGRRHGRGLAHRSREARHRPSRQAWWLPAAAARAVSRQSSWGEELRRRAAQRSNTKLRRSATAATTLASIRPNALRIATLSKYATNGMRPSRRLINAKEVLTPHQHEPVP